MFVYSENKLLYMYDPRPAPVEPEQNPMAPQGLSSSLEQPQLPGMVAPPVGNQPMNFEGQIEGIPGIPTRPEIAVYPYEYVNSRFKILSYWWNVTPSR